MYSIDISSITFTASFAGFQSFPNPYIGFRPEREKGSSSLACCGSQKHAHVLLQTALSDWPVVSIRWQDSLDGPRVSVPTGSVYCVYRIARRRVRCREASSPVGGTRSRAAGHRTPGRGKKAWSRAGHPTERRELSVSNRMPSYFHHRSTVRLH